FTVLRSRTNSFSVRLDLLDRLPTKDGVYRVEQKVPGPGRRCERKTGGGVVNKNEGKKTGAALAVYRIDRNGGDHVVGSMGLAHSATDTHLFACRSNVYSIQCKMRN